MTTVDAPATMTARPSIAASVIATGAAAATAVLVGVAVGPIAIAIAGLFAVAGGLAIARRGHGVLGSAVGIVGGGGCAVAVGLAAVGAGGLPGLLRAVPAVLGVALLGLAVAPLRSTGTRWLVKAGAGGVFLAVVMTGLFRVAPLDTLLLATAGTILAWDAGEHAIDVGRQLGRTASTWRLDVTHCGATAVIGGVGVVAGNAVAGMRAGNLSLSAFVLLGVALVALTLALHR